MYRAVLLFLLCIGCVAAPPLPVPEPCPVVVEPEPCDAITPEQQAVLGAVAEIVAGPLVEQGPGLGTLADERAAAIADVERLQKELEGCRRSNTELHERVEQLETDLEEVKRLTIEMEMKAK